MISDQAVGPRAGSPARKDDDRHRLSVAGGLAALSLDAMASVAYGPEAIVIVAAVAGGAGLRLTLPITLAIAGLLLVLTMSYRQVIAAFPEGGGAYGVSKAYLGRRAALVAGASLVIDYILNVAVSVAAGVAALTSAVPDLHPYTVWLCLGVLALVTAVNLRGIANSARLFIAPTVVFVLAILSVVVVGLLRTGAATGPLAPQVNTGALQTVGLLLVLKAFANGCAALTGVEAIANAVPSFRKPRVRRAQNAELVLGILLGVMLIGIALLIKKFSVRPEQGVTVLAQVTNASLGHGVMFYLVQFITVVLLGLAANTSFGGLPLLAKLLATDNYLPHVFALRAERQVHKYGVWALSAVSALLLVAAGGAMNTLVPLFAIGVFVGFSLSQIGLCRHWLAHRPAGWRGKAALNGFGGTLTAVATVIVCLSKFTAGAWLIVLLLPSLVLLFEAVHRNYERIGGFLRLGMTPPAPRPYPTKIVVPVGGVDRLSQEALSAALSYGRDVVAVHVMHGDDGPADTAFIDAWSKWNPNVPLTVLHDPRRRLAEPVVDYIRQLGEQDVMVLIPEVEPAHMWQRALQNQRGGVLAHALRRDTLAIVSRLRFRIDEPPRVRPVGAQVRL